MLLATACAACDGPDGPVCARCTAALRPAPEVVVAELDSVRALFAYLGPGRRLVHGLKYRNRRAGLGLLAAALAGRLADLDAEVVTWVPAVAAHRRQRGYDQAEVLARRLARRLGVPARRLLDRPADRAQTGLGRADRLAGPTLVARGRVPRRVLVVDDVVTTGGSLAAAARALRAAGAERVDAGVLAVTPG